MEEEEKQKGKKGIWLRNPIIPVQTDDFILYTVLRKFTKPSVRNTGKHKYFTKTLYCYLLTIFFSFCKNVNLNNKTKQ